MMTEVETRRNPRRSRFQRLDNGSVVAIVGLLQSSSQRCPVALRSECGSIRERLLLSLGVSTTPRHLPNRRLPPQQHRPIHNRPEALAVDSNGDLLIAKQGTNQVLRRLLNGSHRDVQDAAGHADPRTTRRYDGARRNLDKHPTYALAGLIV